MRRASEICSKFKERVFHADMLDSAVDLAGDDGGCLFNECVRHHVGKCLKLRAERLEVPKIVDAGDENPVACANERIDVPHVDFRGKAALVVGKRTTAFDGGAVGWLADDGCAVDGAKKRSPQRTVSMKKQRLRYADAL